MFKVILQEKPTMEANIGHNSRMQFSSSIQSYSRGTASLVSRLWDDKDNRVDDNTKINVEE